MTKNNKDDKDVGSKAVVPRGGNDVATSSSGGGSYPAPPKYLSDIQREKYMDNQVMVQMASNAAAVRTAEITAEKDRAIAQINAQAQIALAQIIKEGQIEAANIAASAERFNAEEETRRKNIEEGLAQATNNIGEIEHDDDLGNDE